MSKSKKDETVWVHDNYPGYGLQYNTIETALKILQEAQAAETQGKWRDLTLEIEDGGYDSCSIVLRGMRPETIEERTKRFHDDKRTEQYEREQYARLKAKFDKKE